MSSTRASRKKKQWSNKFIIPAFALSIMFFVSVKAIPNHDLDPYRLDLGNSVNDFPVVINKNNGCKYIKIDESTYKPYIIHGDHVCGNSQ